MEELKYLSVLFVNIRHMETGWQIRAGMIVMLVAMSCQ